MSMTPMKAMAPGAKAACVALTVLPVPAALAHHVVGFAKPTTLGMGLLSGLGHPVISVGSLAFLLAIGLWCAHVQARGPGSTQRQPMIFTLLALLAGTAVGGLLAGAGFMLPADDLLIAVSVIAAGVLLLATRWRLSAGSLPAITVAVGVAALVHGMVAAEGGAGASGSPLLAYWVGILLMQALLWLAAYRAAAAVMAIGPQATRHACSVGAVAAVLAGAALLAYPGLSLLV